jgi:hypothetical protein
MKNKNRKEKYCHTWTLAEDKFILENQHWTDKEIAHTLSKLSGRKITKDALRMRRVRLGIKKSEKPGRGTSKVISVKINYGLLGKKRYRYNIFPTQY